MLDRMKSTHQIESLETGAALRDVITQRRSLEPMMCHCYSKLIATSVLMFVSLPANAQLTVLHEFGSIPDDGSAPVSRLLRVGDTLFSTTLGGGTIGQGALFTVDTEGSNYAVEHNFFTSNSGMQPSGDLAIDGLTLFGTSEFGGATSPFIGTVFSVGIDGSSPMILHEFAGGASDGARPAGGVLRIDSTLYGTTITGGDDDAGTIFSIGTDGSDFMLLHEFDVTNGLAPVGGLVLANGKLFGTTDSGGQDDLGLLYSINTDGSNYTVVHEFTEDLNGERPDGAFPGEIIVDGNTIYGVTGEGGTEEAGAIYKINTDGTGYSVLHSFEEDVFGEYPRGGFPRSAMAISGTTLVGTTPFGGASDVGIVFSLETDGAAFQVLHDFAGGNDDGSTPEAGVIISGSTILGTTRNGGDFGRGTIFSLPLPGGEPLFREADFNEDTLVDNADLVQWESAYGANANGDADGDGDSDGADYLVWQRQFGLPPLLNAATIAVPEPCVNSLTLFAALLAGGIGRQRGSLTVLST